MTSPEDPTPSSTLPRRQLGRFLREHREAAGFTISRAAEQVDLSRAVLQRIETGQIQKVRRQDVQALCDLYDVAREDTKAAVDLAVQGRIKSWYHAYGGLYSSAFNMYVGLETGASKLTFYNEQQIPGLLQTGEYARALISRFPGFTSQEDVDRRVEYRLKRQALITRKRNPTETEVLLHGSVLHRTVGKASTMAAQLRHLAEMSTRANITLRIQPIHTGPTWGIAHGSFSILEFDHNSKVQPAEPTIVYMDGGLTQDVYLENPDEVHRYSRLATAIRDTSLSEVDSRSLLRQMAREFEHRDR